MRQKLRIFSVLILITGIAWLAWDWGHKGVISSVGGLYFVTRLEIPVPRFHQSDELWKNDILGNTSGTMGREGCAVTSAAMVLNYYGIHADPKRLNDFLTYHGGYTER